MSLEIGPLAALYPLPPYKTLLHRAALSCRLGRYAHAYGICTPLYCKSFKNIYRGGGGEKGVGGLFLGK